MGAPVPSKGLSGFPAGSSVTAYAPALFLDQAGVRYFPTGWTGSGSVPASGALSNVTFTINSLSRLTWLWRTDYRVTYTNGVGGGLALPAIGSPRARL